MSWNFAFFLVHIIIIITNSQNFIYSGNYSLSQSNWEATCLFYYDRHLASIHNESERAEAQSTISNTAWIGLSDSVAEDTWVWTDSTAWNYGQTFEESPWGAGEPNNVGEEDCATILTTGLWNDDNCVSANHYGLCGYPSGFIVLNDKTNYIRIRGEGSLVGYIDILDEVSISFYITFQSWPTGWGNILHFGDDDTQRYPAIYIEGTAKYIHSSFGLISEDNPVHDSASGYALNTEYLYTLYQTQTHLTITFAGVTVYDADTDPHPILMNRALYLGSPWHNTFSATFRNMQVSTSNSPENRFWNYLCDDDDGLSAWTPIRWTWNSGTYVYGAVDGDCSVQQTSVTPDSRVAWIGTNDVRSLAWTDYKVEMIINIVSGLGQEAAIIIRANGANCGTQDCGQYYEVRLAFDFVGLRKINNGAYTTIGTDYPITNTGNTPYLIRVEATGSSFAVYEDNVYLKTWTDTSFASGSVGFLTYNVNARFSKMRITFPENQQFYTANPSPSPTKNPTLSPSNFPTKNPTTSVPTTSNPTSSAPTTSNPTTTLPTTSMPTTSNPTSSAPTTSAPTTSVPTTSNPTTAEPSYNPTVSPSSYPTTNPTIVPTASPSKYPTTNPTTTPTTVPTTNPTTDPSNAPSKYPSSQPTNNPTLDPTDDPTNDPSTNPTMQPVITGHPSTTPTTIPTVYPTTDPSNDPTNDPTADPTSDPTTDPTSDPTTDPTTDPTRDPSADPTFDPTVDPTADPTSDPTADPTSDPTIGPTADPTSDPTPNPTSDPTPDPTKDPTADPTTVATEAPVNAAAETGIFLTQELLLLLILGVLVLLIFLCCCFTCIYWIRHKRKKMKKNRKNIEMVMVSTKSSTEADGELFEGDGPDFGGVTDATDNMYLRRINSMSAGVNSGDGAMATTQAAMEEEEEDVVPGSLSKPQFIPLTNVDSAQQVGQRSSLDMQQQIMEAINPMVAIPMMPMVPAMGAASIKAMNSMNAMMPMTMVMMPPLPNSARNMNNYGPVLDNVSPVDSNFDDLPQDENVYEDEDEAEVLEDVYEQNDDGNEDEYDYYYEEDEDEDDNEMYAQSKNPTAGQ